MKLLKYKIKKVAVPRMLGIICDIFINGEDIAGKKEVTLFYHETEQKLLGPIMAEIKVIPGHPNVVSVMFDDNIIEFEQISLREVTMEINGFTISGERHQFYEDGFINTVFVQKTNMIKYKNTCHACGTMFFTVLPVIEQCPICGFSKNNNIEGGE